MAALGNAQRLRGGALGLVRVGELLNGRHLSHHRHPRRVGQIRPAQLRLQLVAAGLIPSDFVSVQCTYFEKSRDHNWLVAPHQDLSIPVGARCAHPGLTGWSEKHGMLFVQPPAAVLEQLVALRLHIDECTCDDGALNVVPGSHLHGRLRDADKAQRRAASGVVRCPVAAGGGMVMRPLLLHASSKATGTSRRRVLHFLFGPPNLPYGLAWPQPAQQV